MCIRDRAWLGFVRSSDDLERLALQHPGFWEWLRRRGVAAADWEDFGALPEQERAGYVLEFGELGREEQARLSRVPVEVEPWDPHNPELLDLDPPELVLLRSAGFWEFLHRQGFEGESWRKFAALPAPLRAKWVRDFEGLDPAERLALEREAPAIPWVEGDPRGLLLEDSERAVLSEPGFWEALRLSLIHI